MHGTARSIQQLAMLITAVSCAAQESQTGVELPRPAHDRASTKDERAPSKRGELRNLDLPGFGAALLFAPSGSGTKPLVVAAHGAGGSPEWECEYWRRLTADRVFVLCLRGTSLGTGSGFYYPNHKALERELVAGEAAARASEPRILFGSGLYAGFSQGASMGSAMIAGHAHAYPYSVLVEGFDQWNVPRARALARNGGTRVLIACGSKECEKVGRTSVRWLSIGGVESRLEYAPGEGHTPMGGVLRAIESSLPWLLGNDPAWAFVLDR